MTMGAGVSSRVRAAERSFPVRLGLAVLPLLAWAAYLSVFAFHVWARSFCDEWLPWRNLYGSETAILGTSASTWLQTNLAGEAGHITARAATALHLGWFAWPIVIGAGITALRRDLLIEYFLWLAAAWFLADVFFLVAPTVPPWMGDPSVQRFLFEQGWIEYAPNDLNAVAAFPSLHACVPLTIAFFIWRRIPAARIVAVTSGLFAAAIGFAVIFLGEHWVLDVAAGYGLAAAIGLGAGSPFARRLARAIPGDPLRAVIYLDARWRALHRPRPAATPSALPAALPGPAAPERAA